MRLERRPQTPAALLVAAPFAAVVVTLLLTSVLVAWAGAPVGKAYALLLQGGFGSRFALTETLTRATPLILTGLAAAVAFRARLFNIGAEGQLYAGALAAVAVGGLHGGSGFEASPWLLFPLMVAAAMAAGAALLLGPALLKSRLGVDEVVTTLLLNFIALLVVSAMLDGPMKDPTAMGWPQSVALQETLQLGKLIERSRVHTGLLAALGLSLALWALLRWTDLGKALRASAEDPAIAAAFGIHQQRNALLLAGTCSALAGVAGVCLALGSTLAPSQIYAWVGVVFAAVMLGGLGRALAPLIAGIVIGVSEAVTMAVTAPSWAPLVSFALLIAILLFRPGRAS